MRAPRLAIGALLGAALACGSAGAPAEPRPRTVLAGEGATPGRPPSSSSADPACAQHPRVRDYVLSVRRKVCAHWQRPAELPPGSAALIRFVLAPSGALEWLEVLETNRVELADGVVAALRGAQPFEPMPAGLECLGHERIVAWFGSPEWAPPGVADFCALAP
jgi:hypothetical protein